MQNVQSRGFIRSVSVIKDILPTKISMRIRGDRFRIRKDPQKWHILKILLQLGVRLFPPTWSNHKEIKRSTCIQAQDKREENMEEMIKRIKQHEVYIAEVS
jgi:hypothetical protein